MDFLVGKVSQPFKRPNLRFFDERPFPSMKRKENNFSLTFGDRVYSHECVEDSREETSNKKVDLSATENSLRRKSEKNTPFGR